VRHGRVQLRGEEDHAGRKVKVLGATFEEANLRSAETGGRIASRDERLGFIRSAMRYWYSAGLVREREEKTGSLRATFAYGSTQGRKRWPLRFLK
jgi:hypothetical protein